MALLVTARRQRVYGPRAGEYASPGPPQCSPRWVVVRSFSSHVERSRRFEINTRSAVLLRDIQRSALNESANLSDLLRKCIALGGASQSRALVNWASSELDGYEARDEVPAYRIVSAPLMIDGIAGWTQFKRHHVAPSALPEFARESISEEVVFQHGVGTLEEFAVRTDEGDSVLISPAGSADLIRYWNHEIGSDVQELHRLYWSVSKAEIVGILHRIRNRLVKLLAEFELEYESAESTAQAFERAFQITTGDGSNIAVVSSGGQLSNNMESTKDSSHEDRPAWTLARKIWAGIVGVAGIMCAVFAYLALPG